MATTKFSVGDLVFRYAGGKKSYIQGNAGIVQEVPPPGVPADERHAYIRLINGDTIWIDIAGYGSAGKPFPRKGRVVVKWLNAQGPGGGPLDEMAGSIGNHEEWLAEMFTNSGWALARDPWGVQHWLPPRREPGVDSIYVFYQRTDKEEHRYVVTMQQTPLP